MHNTPQKVFLVSAVVLTNSVPFFGLNTKITGFGKNKTTKMTKLFKKVE